ncbi:hypothetical protein E2P81_ATG06372 [Venturia nashicola]|uniref:Uncharacterized protein n=1 Tax=Venturia nashicola TaxID=86259 RepID=A0A4Z1P2V9_9PEZI|nr:hypothetical protein E6O75_ATG06526 [Venturia nashicola]TLD28026.1 hypothetical protein E2P81_ATG06372 [Venturia nashicola]
MDCAGAAFSITPLLIACSKISTVLLNVGRKFKKAPLLMTSIGTECNLIHVALSQVRSFDWGSLAGYPDGRLEQMTRATESVILGCQLTLSVIEEYAIELQDYVEGSPLSPTEQMGIMARVRVLWKEEEMRELLLQLRGYQSGLTGLIRAAHDSDFSDPHHDFAASSFAALLQRSRSSRVRKPLSIRAAMQQAATYSTLSRSTTSSSSSHTSKSNHSATPSTSTIQSRQSSTTSSVSQQLSHAASMQSLSGATADLYDGATHTTSNRKPTGEAARKKRPGFLTLQPEESSSTVVEGRDVHYTKRKKDQLRRSSPTVGENFRFVPGEPPLSALATPPRPPPKDVRTIKAPKEEIGEMEEERSSEPTFLLEPRSSPPTAPLPNPPSTPPPRSRSPTAPLPNPPSTPPLRSRSPSKTPEIPARAPSRLTRMASRREFIDRHPVSAPSSQQVAPLKEESEHQRGPSESEVVMPREEPKMVEETSEAANSQSHPAIPPADQPPTPQTPGSSIAGLRTQKSASSMRSLIIGLPQTARLRKGASADAVRKQPSVERLNINTEVDEPVPALPTTEVVAFVRGNAFAQQSHTSMSPPPRTSSIEGLSERIRKRSATDLGNDMQTYNLPLRAQRDMGRAASDARRPQYLRFPAPRRMDDGTRTSPPTSASVSSPSSSFGSPLSEEPTSASSGTWPLTPEDGHSSDYTYSHKYTPGHTTQYLQTSGDHSRSTSSERFSAPSEFSSRTLSSVQTPRASYSLTPRTGRSRNNTLMAMNSETGTGETIDKGVSTVGSMAPSVMSAQWFRTPQERLGLGTTVNRAEALPWEELDVSYENSGPPMLQKPKTPPAKISRMGNGVANMFSVFPPRAPSQTVEKDERCNESPPRSPLLTPSFLSDVQTTLPSDRPTEVHVIGDTLRPSTSNKSHEGAITPDWSRTKSMKSIKEQKEEKKKKKKENSRFPTLSDMVKEYKAMTAIRYTSSYAQAAEEQRIEKGILEGKRPATSSTSSTRLGPTSLDIQITSPTTFGSKKSNSDGDRIKSLRTMPSTLSYRPSIDSFASHAGTINAYTNAHSAANARYIDAADVMAARVKADKKKQSDRKKSGAFPTVREMWSEYKKSADSWYTAGYHEEEMRNVTTPTSHFS